MKRLLFILLLLPLQASAELLLLSPQPEQQIRANDGRLRVEYQLPNSLRTNVGQKLRVLLDQQTVPFESDDNGLWLHSLGRGEHHLQVQLLDENDLPILQSPEIRFYLHRYSRQLPAH